MSGARAGGRRRVLRILFAAAWLAVFGCAGHDEWRDEQEARENAQHEHEDRGGKSAYEYWRDQQAIQDQLEEDENDQPPDTLEDDEDAKDEWTNWS